MYSVSRSGRRRWSPRQASRRQRSRCPRAAAADDDSGDGGCVRRRHADHRHHRQGHLARPGRLVRQRLVRGDEPGLPVPAEHHARQPGRRARHRRIGRVHLADRVHGQAQAGPEIGQRPRPRPPRTSSSPSTAQRRDHRPERPGRRCCPTSTASSAPDDTTVVFNAQDRERPDLPADPVQPGRPDRRRGGLLGRQAHPGRRRSSTATPSPASTRSTATTRTTWSPSRPYAGLPGPAGRRPRPTRSTSSTTPTPST